MSGMVVEDDGLLHRFDFAAASNEAQTYECRPRSLAANAAAFHATRDVDLHPKGSQFPTFPDPPAHPASQSE